MEASSSSLLALPKRNQGEITNKFKRTMLNSNRYKVDVSEIEHLSIFAIKFIPDIKNDVKGEKAAII